MGLFNVRSQVFFVACLCVTLLVPGLALAEANNQPQIGVTVQGKAVKFPDAKPQNIKGRTMVPLRAVFEAMGAKVNWNDSTQQVTATISKDNIDVQFELRIGSPFIQRTMNDKYGNVRSTVQQLDVPAQVVGNSTMIPLRASGEALGSEVKWDAKTQTANLKFTGFMETEQSFPEYKVKGSIWDVESVELVAFFETNKVRLDNKVLPLTLNTELVKAGRVKSNDFIVNKYFDHISPKLGAPEVMLANMSFPGVLVGENIHFGTENGIGAVNWWVNSPSHFEALINPAYTEVGIGRKGTYWTQLFATTTTKQAFKQTTDRQALAESSNNDMNTMVDFDVKAQAEREEAARVDRIYFSAFIRENAPNSKYTRDELVGVRFKRDGVPHMYYNYLFNKNLGEIKVTADGLKNPETLAYLKSILGKKLNSTMPNFEDDIKAITKVDDTIASRMYHLERVDFEYSGGDLYLQFTSFTVHLDN